MNFGIGTKKCILALLSLLVLLTCPACALYDKEYVAVEDYVFPASNSIREGDKLTAANYEELTLALRSIADAGLKEGSIVFTDAYPGDVSSDIERACLQVRLQDPLCAYCIEDFTYTLNQIVTLYEAKITVNYQNTGVPFEDIHKLQFTTGFDRLIGSAISRADRKLVVSINRSAYGLTDVNDLISEVYSGNPGSCPVTPKSNVRMFSGSGGQRLYEINFYYPDYTEEKAQELQSALKIDEKLVTDYEKAAYACERLREVVPGEGNNLYDALVAGEAGDEGVALAYVALCKELGLDCRIVHGEHYDSEYCWNIVKIGDEYWHAVIQSADGGEAFRNDMQMIESFRWDTQEYPACNGDLAELIVDV